MNLVNTEYITVDQLLESVSNDFKKYEESGLIDKSSLYKIVAYCNSSAGIRINPIRHCVLDIKDGKIDIPSNFKKIRNIDIISYHKSNFNTSIPYMGKATEIVTKMPDKTIPVYTPFGCLDAHGQCFWEIPKVQKHTEEFIVVKDATCLQEGFSKDALSKNEFIIDKEEGVIYFGSKTGRVILNYYKDLDSLALVPKEPMLYFYYEWSIKVKILQDILMNSEDDVVNKLQLAEKEKFGAYVDFDNYIKSESYRKAKQRHQKEYQEFEEKWFNPFY
jgi:hypothetical protein